MPLGFDLNVVNSSCRHLQCLLQAIHSAVIVYVEVWTHYKLYTKYFALPQFTLLINIEML